MNDPYWTDARREAVSRGALPFEPYRGHRVEEVKRAGARTYRYIVLCSPVDYAAPFEARAAIDRCVDGGGNCELSVAVRKDEADPFARFGR